MTKWYVCGSYREFRQWRYEHSEIPRENVVYVSSDGKQLRGVTGEVRIVRLSSFYDWTEHQRMDANYYIESILNNPNVIPYEGKLTTRWEW